jgi:hypothetical protein
MNVSSHAYKIEASEVIGEPTAQMLTMEEEWSRDSEIAMAAPVGSKIRWSSREAHDYRVGVVTEKGFLEVKREESRDDYVSTTKVFFDSVGDWIARLDATGCLTMTPKDTRPKIVQLATMPFNEDADDGMKIYELHTRFRVTTRVRTGTSGKAELIRSGRNKIHVMIDGTLRLVAPNLHRKPDSSWTMAIARIDTGTHHFSLKEMGASSVWVQWRDYNVMVMEV